MCIPNAGKWVNANKLTAFLTKVGVDFINVNKAKGKVAATVQLLNHLLTQTSTQPLTPPAW